MLIINATHLHLYVPEQKALGPSHTRLEKVFQAKPNT